jgi:predicted DNA-binding transcriptional regulator YafY
MELVSQGAEAAAVGSSAAAAVRIDYVNWRGERGWRRIIPRRLYFAAVEWHPGDQWILDAWDVDKQDLRSFAMKDIRAWAPADSVTSS